MIRAPRLIPAGAHRRLGQSAEAVAILRPLARAFAAAAHTQYELGLVLAAQGDRADVAGAHARGSERRSALDAPTTGLCMSITGVADAPIVSLHSPTI